MTTFYSPIVIPIETLTLAVSGEDNVQPSSLDSPFVIPTFSITAENAVSTYYDADSTTTIITTPAVGSSSGSVLTSTVPGAYGTGSPPTLVASAEASSHFTLSTASIAGISVATAISLLVLVVGPLAWLWRQRWRYRWGTCQKQRREGGRGPRTDALSAAGARRDALSDSETDVGTKRLSRYEMGMEPEDEIHRAQWEWKKPLRESKEGIAELEGNACHHGSNGWGVQSSGVGELDGTETGSRMGISELEGIRVIEGEPVVDGGRSCA